MKIFGPPTSGSNLEPPTPKEIAVVIVVIAILLIAGLILR